MFDNFQEWMTDWSRRERNMYRVVHTLEDISIIVVIVVAGSLGVMTMICYAVKRSFATAAAAGITLLIQFQHLEERVFQHLVDLQTRPDNPMHQLVDKTLCLHICSTIQNKVNKGWPVIWALKKRKGYV